MDPNSENSLSQDVGFLALIEGMRGDESGSSNDSPDWRENNMAWEREEEDEEEPASSPASHISTNSKDTDEDGKHGARQI